MSSHHATLQVLLNIGFLKEDNGDFGMGRDKILSFEMLGGCSNLLLDIHSCHVLHHRWQASHDRQHLRNHVIKSYC